MPKGIYKHKPLSEMTRRKISEKMKRNPTKYWLGKEMSEEHRKKISETQKRVGNCPPSYKNKKHTERTKRKISEIHKGKGNPMYGKCHTEEAKRRIASKSIFQKGKNHPNWQGGISNNPYPKEFTAKLKLKIRTRDNFTCCLCGKTEREELEELNRVLCVNHKDFDKNNCKENNLNTLCLRCNIKINRDREYWTNYFNN